MTGVLIGLHGFFDNLTTIAAGVAMLLMALDGQRPYGAARAVWNVAWTLMGITALCTLGLFLAWLAERA